MVEKIFGYRVIEAEGGAAAVAILEAGEAIDLIISDVVMPGDLLATSSKRVAERTVL